MFIDQSGILSQILTWISDCVGLLVMEPLPRILKKMDEFLNNVKVSSKQLYLYNSIAEGVQITENWGRKFPFLNRDEECQEFGNMLCKLEAGRGKGWDVYKRNFQIPLCLGLSGIGKTTFARRAIGKVDSSKCLNPDFIKSMQNSEHTLNVRLGMEYL